ncbi:MAG: hypothetical protein IJL37_00230 [Bacteroidaceae bacterium]|nr:hypothetical protein [Bacteroidaceae bacterium]
MKYYKLFIFLISSTILFVACGSLKKPVIQQNEPLTSYKYFYITPTTELTSGTGGVYGGQYGVYGGSSTKTINPSDIIAGTLLKQGFIRLPELDTQLLSETLLVNYGESGRRSLNLGYSIEVTIQFLAAQTHSVVCICTAEGQGSTEADDIRIAINRALSPLFE